MGDPYERERQFLMDRRRFLALSGAGAAAALFAACGLSSDSATSTGTTAGGSPSQLPPVGGPLNLYSWEGYDTAGDLTAWMKQQGIDANVKYITTPEEVPTVLKGPGGEKWDIAYGDNVVLTDYADLGLIAPMSVDQVPGLAGLLPALQVPPWKNDDGTFNGSPWTWGYSGVTYRTDRVPNPASWQDLLKSQFKGRVSTIDSATNNVALGAIAVGIDPDTMTTDQLKGPVKDYLTKLIGQTRTLAPSIGDSISLLVSGDVDYMVVGLTFMDSVTAKKGVPTKTVIPSEGAIGWADTAFITPTAPNPQNAYAFVNHLLEPAVNAQANSSLLQGASVTDAIPLLTPKAKALYPYDNIDDYLSNTLTFNRGWPHEPDGDLATYDEIIATWEEVKGS
jgi:spermidine/putrescine transport system substrate-binding protein